MPKKTSAKAKTSSARAKSSSAKAKTSSAKQKSAKTTTTKQVKAAAKSTAKPAASKKPGVKPPAKRSGKPAAKPAAAGAKSAANKIGAKQTAASKSKPAAASSKATIKKPAAKKLAAKAAAQATAAVAQATATAAPATASTVKPTKKVPLQLGKHAPKTYPEHASPSDFKCYGPPATKDGEFDQVMICDMGCFTQDGKDSNKYYHGAVVQHGESGNWYAYFEWGRTGAAVPSFQFIGCRDQRHAQAEFAKQLHSKNDRRGEWATVAGLRTLRARKGKDCYLVRPMATRSTGLPDARSIKINEGAKQQPQTKTKAKAKKSKYDPQTVALMRDLAAGTVAYTRGSMADESLPTQQSIDDARQLLNEAQKRVAKVGDNLKKQTRDKQLLELTTLMYSRIPKRKPVGAAASTWILSKDNILTWQQDLDAFESALYTTDIDHDQEDQFEPFPDVQIDMEWVSPDSKVGKFLYDWWPQATANRHGWVGNMQIKNLWQLERHDDRDKIPGSQQAIAKNKPKIKERPSYQPKTREDLGAAARKRFADTNTALLFHGTRSVNVGGILREALRLPKQLVGVVITGAMFGPGLYFADDWKKSAGYTSLQGSYWSSGAGAVRGRNAFMFACDVVLGSPFAAPKWGPYTEPPKGHHSVFGKAGRSGVQNNEFIIYKPEQNRLRYLIEFATTKKK